MEPVGHRAFLPLVALIFSSAVFSIIVSTLIQAGETPVLLLAATAPTERFSPSISWVDDLEDKLNAYFPKKYPAYNFAPYKQELERIRGAVSRGDRWGVKREVGVFLEMLLTHAYGLGDDAADELAVISNQIMPEEEFGIIYPGSRDER